MRRRDHKIVTLVGSTKPQWRERYAQVNRDLTCAGYLVISVGVFRDDVPNIEQYRDTLESIHRQKIDMADIVVVISEHAVEEGSHTQLELDYCKKVGKPVSCYSPNADWNREIKDRLKEAA